MKVADKIYFRAKTFRNNKKDVKYFTGVLYRTEYKNISGPYVMYKDISTDMRPGSPYYSIDIRLVDRGPLTGKLNPTTYMGNHPIGVTFLELSSTKDNNINKIW